MSIPIGLVVPDEPAGGWATLPQLAADAEACGAASLWLTDHLVWHRPTVDVIGGLHALAAATERCLVGPCVLQLPLRQLAATAKSMSYLGSLAPGRVVLGVGIGEHEAEYAAAGVRERFARRGALLDVGIDELRATLAGGVAGGGVDGSPTDDGAHLRLLPAEPLPIWVGGRSPAARRRAAVRGDGWIPHLTTPAWLEAEVGGFHDDLLAAGRERSDVVLAPNVVVYVDGIEDGLDPTAWFGRLYDLPPAAFRSVVVRGSAQQVAEQLAAAEALGADHLVLAVASDRPVEHFAAIMAAWSA